MKRLRAYGLCITAAILAILTSPASLLIGLPIGIWALVVLSDEEVQAAFPKKVRVPPQVHVTAVGYVGLALVLLSFFVLVGVLSMGPRASSWLDPEAVGWGAMLLGIVGVVFGVIGAGACRGRSPSAAASPICSAAWFYSCAHPSPPERRAAPPERPVQTKPVEPAAERPPAARPEKPKTEPPAA